MCLSALDQSPDPSALNTDQKDSGGPVDESDLARQPRLHLHPVEAVRADELGLPRPRTALMILAEGVAIIECVDDIPGARNYCGSDRDARQGAALPRVSIVSDPCLGRR